MHFHASRPRAKPAHDGRAGSRGAGSVDRSVPHASDTAYEDSMQLDVEWLSFDPFADRIREIRHAVMSHDAVRCGGRGARMEAALCEPLQRLWWPGSESNQRHADFQSAALPTELPGRRWKGAYLTSRALGASRTIPEAPSAPGLRAVRAADGVGRQGRSPRRRQPPAAAVFLPQGGAIRARAALPWCGSPPPGGARDT